MERRRLERRSMGLMLLCSVLWSISGILIKSVPWNPLAIAGARGLIAACVMALYMRVTKRRFVVNRVSLLSAVLMSLMFFSFTAANKLTTAANAIVIQSTAPAFILIYNVTFGKQRLRRLDLLTVILTMAGIALFFLDQLTPGRMLGNAVALFAGVMLAAVYIVTCGAEQNACMSGILMGHLLTAAVGLPTMLMTETAFTPVAIAGILTLGIVQLGIPYALYGIAVKYCPPLAASLIGITEAIFNPIWVFLIMGEAPGTLALLGGVMVLATLAAWTVLSQRIATRDAA